MEFKVRQLSVDPSDPFKGDCLGRQREVENLTLLIQNMTPPIVLAVNSPWGTGKTTFIQMWAAYLRQQGFPVLQFNAWETDFSPDPLVSFLGEMNQGLSEFLNKTNQRKIAWEKAKTFGVKIAKIGVPSLIKIGTAGLIDARDFIGNELSSLAGEVSTDALKAYEATRSSIAIFKESLTEVLGSTDGCGPLVVFVDELDRCRPDYSIDLLERIKHLFNQPGIIFVLAIDREQLAHSVKAIYGEGLDSHAYLQRFIDIEYSLSKPDPTAYIDQLHKTFNFEAFFKSRVAYTDFQYDWEHLSKTLALLARLYNLKLRELEHLFARLNLAIRATKENEYIYPSLLAFLVVLRDKNRMLYEAYIRESESAQKVIDYLDDLLPPNERQKHFEMALIEGFIIAAKGGWKGLASDSQLAQHHTAVTESDSLPWAEREYSTTLLNVVAKPVGMGRRIALEDLAQRIEMLRGFNFPQQEET